MKKLRNNFKIDDILGLLIFLFSAFLMLYYVVVIGKGYYHSDCTDTILWAEAALNGNGFTDTDFCYAGCMPLGGQVFMLLPVALWGVSLKAQIVGMLLFETAFFAALYYLFRMLDIKRSRSLIYVSFLMLILLCSTKLREIFFEHILYYSLDILFVSVGVGLILKIMGFADEKGNGIPWKQAVLLFLTAFLAAANGEQMLAIADGALLVSVIAYRYFCFDESLFPKRDIKTYVPFVSVFLGTAAGYLLYKLITHDISVGYATAYSAFSPVSEWNENLFSFFPQLFGLLGVKTDKSMNLFSLEGIEILIKVFFGIMVTLVPVAAAFSYKKLPDKTKLLLLVHYATCAVVLVGWVFGLLNSASWRLSPILVSGTIVTLVIAEHMLCGKTVRIAAAILGMVTAFSVFVTVDLLTMPKQSKSNEAHVELMDFLEDEGLEYGYATFWNAGIITLLSDSEIKVRNVIIDSDDVKPYLYQTNREWYEVNGYDRYFLILTASEYETYNKYGSKYNELSVRQCGNFYVLTYDYNIMK